jgi:hypothetical protein
MTQQEVRKNQSFADGYSLRFPNHIPIEPDAPEVARKALFQLTIERLERRRRHDGIARANDELRSVHDYRKFPESSRKAALLNPRSLLLPLRFHGLFACSSSPSTSDPPANRAS